MENRRIECSRIPLRPALLALFFLSGLAASDESSYCTVNPVIFNFGDSNSDTGGYAAAFGLNLGYPEGRVFFHRPTGRLCDGRLIIDFLCESMNASYLSPYLDSLLQNFTFGANFAIAGSTTVPYNPGQCPQNPPFPLDGQLKQFTRFQRLFEGSEKSPGREVWGHALYMIDIGQNDLGHIYGDHAMQLIPSFINKIGSTIKRLYELGGRNFWVHNTGPLGCLPEQLWSGTVANASDVDENGCLRSRNEVARAFNAALFTLCDDLRPDLPNATIVYVDVYSVKYDLIAHASAYGFEHPLMGCCGHGGPPYNYDPKVLCGQSGCNVCEDGSRYISWDGVHYTEAANAIVASKILSTHHSSLPLNFSYFCRT